MKDLDEMLLSLGVVLHTVWVGGDEFRTVFNNNRKFGETSTDCVDRQLEELDTIREFEDSFVTGIERGN
jgi:hypothetical protein